MARPKKRGTSGAAKNFITRTQAVRKLQISLPDFRRLCIFKGIYPREPRHKKKASKSSTQSTTFYYTRDIQYLLHEPLLAKFRDHKALAKKIGRALGRGEVSDAARLEKNLTPRMTLDHIVKERYPTFVDALRDLDDALSMLFLFANLPSTSTIPPKTIALCQRLCLEFEHYLIVSHSLRKSFLSIKGIYYQATIQGQDILWLVPYKFVQRVTGDIDFRIMGTFVEFYTTLLGFVNYRLYTSVGLVYPPKFDAKSDDLGGELDAFAIEGRDVGDAPKQIDAANDSSTAQATSKPTDEAATAKAQAAANSLKATEDPQTSTEENQEAATGTEIDTFDSAGAGGDVLPQPTTSANTAATLFSPFTFYLSRETPRAPLEFLLRAFGCKRVGWDSVLGAGAFTTDPFDSRITHQIVDRPPIPEATAVDDEAMDEEDKAARARARALNARVLGRTYVQPQWVWDCVNAGKLQRPDHYAPGATLPYHMSPWVKSKRGEYDPTAPLEADDEEEAVTNDAEAEEAEEEGSDEEMDGEEDEEDAGISDSEAAITGKAQPASDEEDAFAGFSDEENVAARSNLSQHQRELQAEARGVPLSSILKKPAAQQQDKAPPSKKAKAKRDHDEELTRQKMMMPRRKRKLFEKMQYSNAKTDDEAEKLRKKRRRFEREKAATAL